MIEVKSALRIAVKILLHAEPVEAQKDCNEKPGRRQRQIN